MVGNDGFSQQRTFYEVSKPYAEINILAVEQQVDIVLK